MSATTTSCRFSNVQNHKCSFIRFFTFITRLNLLDPEVLETSFGMSLDDAFETRYQFWDFNEGHIAMTKCMILKSFLIVQPAMFSQVSSSLLKLTC